MKYNKKITSAQIALSWLQIALRCLLMGGLGCLSACQMLPANDASANGTGKAAGALQEIPSAAQAQFDAALAAQKAQQWPEAEQ
ncbi:MAG TPA: hypothetical protein VLC91_02860, partial [Spongiibacteraceae bacterium]|nr:hypothetical protein [Spongiibacteraceae bacterium]